jgi:chemotaxis-related protein WspB
MLYLLFQLGQERYALSCQRIERILPRVRLKALPHAPPCVAGLLDCREKIIPVIDLCALATGQPASRRLSSRIILVNYRAHAESGHLLGLLAEDVTETLQMTEEDLAPTGLKVEQAPYLGKVASSERRMIQIIEVDRLLPPSLQDSLFQPEAATS